MIRAVVDANVLASGFAGLRQPRSIPGEVVRRWRHGSFELIVSEHLRNEVVRTLRKPYFHQRLSPALLSRAAALLFYEATQTPITVEVSSVATHPEDDLVLATAVSVHADYLVTGDGPLRRRVSSYMGVGIVTPREFVDLLQAEGGTQ